MYTNYKRGKNTKIRRRREGCKRESETSPLLIPAVAEGDLESEEG